MKKLALLLTFMLVPFAACSTPTFELNPTTTTALTTAFEYIYLSEEEIDEIFYAAWSAYANFHGVNVDWDISINNEQEFFRMRDPHLQSLAALETAMLEYFSPQLVQLHMDVTRSRLIEHEGALYSLIDGVGGAVDTIHYARIISQTETQRTYQIRLIFEPLEELGDSYIFVRELIDNRWVFTEFPRGWWGCWWNQN